MLGIFEKYCWAIAHYYFPKLLQKGKEKKNIKWPLDTFLFTFKKKLLITNFIFLELSRKENIF